MILMPAMTRAEAVDRRRLLDVHSSSVDLDLTRGAEVFGSTTVISFACTEPGAATYVDVKPSVLRSARLNGRELDPAALADGRLPLDGLEAENELRIEADMAYSHTGEGMHRFTDPADGEDYVYSQAFLDDGPRIFACFDQPDLKAVHQVSVTAPEEWTVVGNSVVARREGGRWEFAPTPPISSYLVAVVAGPLHSVLSEHDGIPLGLHCRRSLAPYLDADAAEILQFTRQSFDHYHRIFEHRFPFDSYDQCFVPEFNAGAMENPGCVTFRDEFVFRSAVTENEREQRAMVVAHEMAHMWFGDLVTMRWWDDLWLNEAFAEYLGHQTVSEATRFTGVWTGFACARKAWGYDADQRPSTHPVAPEDVADTAEALQNFDGISYSKGASLLRQLVAYLGEEDFLNGLNEHFRRHAFGNATLDDLLRSLAGATDRDVQAWAASWLRTTGVDTLRVEGTDILHSSADGTLRPHRITAGEFDRAPDGRLIAASRIPLDLPAEPVHRWRETGTAEPALLLLNDTDLSYVKIRFDERSWRTVRDSLNEVPDALARAVVWNAARDLVREAEIDPAEFLELVAAHLPGEESSHIVQAVLGYARDTVADCYTVPEQRPAALAVLVGVCRALLRRTEGGPDESGLRLLAVRGLIDSTYTPVEIAELQQWRAEDTVPGGPVLDPDLRWQILARLCVLGAAGTAEIDAELVRDPSAIGERGAARCRASLPEADAKEAAWQLLFHSDASAYIIAATARGLWQPEQAELLGELPLRYFEDVVATGSRRGPAIARALGRAGFPAYAATPQTLAAAEACLGRDDLTAATRRVLEDEVDDLRRALRVRGAAR
ncbi:aminopeptidase N [Streptacidiphilus sp. PB12-B1b]|uniref:aminopeptidase N n=1 Tax=Streptacidiphilus sp. PB12-B1b TaxID=2705012 RepID=UPI0015FB5135|nr:aminopeptidase N [Streptacidiphilus sp. PB12-B1b]QMU78571.1 aminopeptidase N [Streptacidiphilus sp. PB12-B1b]